MEFVVGQNTYMTVEEADSIINDLYFENEEEYELWDSLDDTGKQRLILKGTRLIENLPFLGVQYPGYQPMSWPRLIGFKYYDCPYDIKVAIIKQVLKEKLHNKTEEHSLQELGVKSYSIKGASISFTDSSNGNGSKLSNGIYSSIFNEYLVKWVY